MITKNEVVKLLLEEIDRCRRAPGLNGCEMREEWQKTIDVCSIAVSAIREQEERENPAPLTLDELRQMDGEPVWIDDWLEDSHGWELSEDASDYFDGDSRTVESYGTRWVSYRNKPKEDAT